MGSSILGFRQWRTDVIVFEKHYIELDSWTTGYDLALYHFIDVGYNGSVMGSVANLPLLF